MTDQKQDLYQVWATETKTGEFVPVPFFPRMIKPAVEQFAFTLRQQINLGRETRYADPQVVIHQSIVN